jgi:plastocyanin domain-containing protein
MNRNMSRLAYALGAILLVLAFAGCNRGPKTSSQTSSETTPAPVASAGAQEVQLTVTDQGFEPAEIKVQKDRPIVLTVTRKTDATCAREIVFKEIAVKQDLPLNQAVRIELPASPTGTLNYACGMDMIKGSLIVQ